MILDEIKNFTKNLLQEIKDERIHLVSHFDTDGITSAAIFIKTLEKLSKQFSVKILKGLTKEEIEKFPEDKVLILLDLGSSHLNELSKLKNKVFIIDHHEIKNQIPSQNITSLPKSPNHIPHAQILTCYHPPFEGIPQVFITLNG